MADYSQPVAVTKRVRFFDGQYLQDQDFVDEQKYQLDRTRRLSRLLGFTGIGDGLVVSQVAGKPYTLVVSAGTAVDPLGRQLVLPADVTLVLPADKFARQQNVAVLIAFRESETDVAQTGGRSARRWDESPVIAAVTTGGAVAVAPADASTTLDKVTVPLATVSINDTGVIVVSRAVGRPTGLTVGSMTATGNVGIGTAEPKARLEIAGGLGGTSIDLILSGRLKSDSTEGGMWIAADRFVGGFEDKLGLYNATAQWGLVMAKNGDVGIGTTAPENAEGWTRTLDLYGKGSAKLSVRMEGIETRMMAHPGWWGAPAGMVLGTKTTHAVSIGTNSASRLTITTAGDVGIGTTAPENAEGWSRTLDTVGAWNVKLSLRTTSGTPIDGRVMVHSDGLYGAPAGMILGTKTKHPVSVGTNAASRLTVTADGDVGIGTASPAARLEVAGKGGSNVDLVVSGRLRSNTDDGGLWVKDDRFVGGLAEGRVGFFNTTANWGLVMTKTGDVGIGTTAPENAEGWARTLDLYGKASAKLSVRMEGIETRLMAHTGFWGAPGGMVLGTKTNHAVSVGTNAATRLTVSANGDVGIGTITPENADGWARTLDVYAKEHAKLSVRNEQIDARVMAHGGVWGAPAGMVLGTKGTHSVSIATASATRLTVSDKGDVGIGTTPDNSEGWSRVLDAVGDWNMKLSLRTTRGTSPIDGRVMVHSDGLYGAPPGMIVGTKSNHHLSFVTNGQNRMYINAAGESFFNGTIWFPIVSISGWGGESKYGNVNTRYYWTLGRWSWNTNNPAADAVAVLSGSPMPSDLRLKETMVELSGAASRIERLRGVTFNWNSDGLRYLTNFVDDQISAGPEASEEANQAAREEVRTAMYPALSRSTIGVIAQEVQAVLPELVYTGSDGIMKVDYGKLSAVLVQAVKEQQGAIRALTERLDALAITRPADLEEN